MKTILSAITILVSMTNISQAQRAILILKDSSKLQISTLTYTPDAFLVNGHGIEFTEIRTANFEQARIGDKPLQEKLNKAGVKITFGFKEKFVETNFDDLDKFNAQKWKPSGLSNDGVVINGINLNTLDVGYIEVVGFSPFLSNKVIVSVYYGQPWQMLDQQTIKNNAGQSQKFNGMIDALNYLNRNGWEFINAYSVSTANQNVYHYILHKKG